MLRGRSGRRSGTRLRHTALGGKPPKPSYLIRQLDLVDDDNVEYTTSNASDITNPNESAIPRQVVGSENAMSDQDIPACWTNQRRRWHGPVRTARARATHCQWRGYGRQRWWTDRGCGVGWQPTGRTLLGQLWRCALSPLLPLLNDTVTYAYAINNDGVICGCSGHAVYVDDRDGNPVFDHYEYRPVVWRVNAVDIFGPVKLPGSQPDWASAINYNDAAGWGDCCRHPVQPRLDGSIAGGMGCSLWVSLWFWIALWCLEGVNRTGTEGTVCGAAETSNPLLQAVVWTGSTKLALKGARFYITRAANDINDQGALSDGPSTRRTYRVAYVQSCGPVQPGRWSC